MAGAEKIIGVLGGMGPEATLRFFELLIKLTPAAKDQDHLRIIIDNNPHIPDRTAAILKGGPSPLPHLIQSARALEVAGADLIAMPCVTAHYFLDELSRRTARPVLSILDAVAEAVEEARPGPKRLGLLATSGTIQSGLFQRRLSKSGLETLVPDEADQTRIMSAVYDIKNARPARSRAEIAADLAAAARGLIDRGAEGIVAGCTEIPLALSQDEIPRPYFDALLLLARKTLRAVGRRPMDSLSPSLAWKRNGEAWT